MKENFKTNKSLTGKLCDFRGHTVLVVKKLNLIYNIHDDSLEIPQRYEVMFNDGSIDVVSINSLKIMKQLDI